MTSVSTDRRQGVNVGIAIKVPCKAATTANITLSGEQTVDGVALVTGNRCLVKNQTTGANNGIYTVDTGTWTRAPDFDGTYDVKCGTLVYITNGTVATGLFYVLSTADTITIGTTSLTFAVVSPSSPISLPLSLAQGGTAATSAISALSSLGVIQVTAEAGTANAQTGTVDALVTALRADQVFLFVPSVTNTSATTLTITPSGSGALAAKSIFYDGAALTGGELVINIPVLLLYDGTQFQIVGYSRKVRGSQLSAASGFVNGTLTASQNGTVLTVAVKTLAGADPSAADPVGVIFRSVTATTGDYTVLWLTAANSIATTVGGTFGVANTIPLRLWVTGFNDGGTFRLALVNCLTTVAGAGSGRDVTSIFALSQFGIASATQIGAGSTSAGVFYSFGAAVASKAYTTLGYLTYESGLATAGTFAVTHTRLDLFRQGVPLPGQAVQPIQRNDTGAAATGATAIPDDDTIPQITEGDQYMTQAITPTSGTNVLRVSVMAWLSQNSGTRIMAMALFQDTTANALRSQQLTQPGANLVGQLALNHAMLAATVVATTFRMRAGADTAISTGFNGTVATRKHGGVANSFMQVEEIMG